MQAFFCGRSDYFKALLEDHFGENECSDDIPVVYLHDISLDIFIRILTYIYSDSCEVRECNITFSVTAIQDFASMKYLHTSDLLLSVV